MKIGFDAKRLFNNFTGLGNYSRFVVNALLDYAPGNEYLLYTPKRRNHPEVNAIVDRKDVSVITPSSLIHLLQGRQYMANVGHRKRTYSLWKLTSFMD